MRLKRYITELSAKNVHVEIKRADNKAFVTRIVTNPEISMAKIDDPSLLVFEFYARKIKIIEFLTAHLGLAPAHAEDNFDTNDIIWDVGFEDEYGNYEQISKDRKTALEVFAGVEESFRTFIQKYNPNIFEFSSVNERSRRKLYDLIAKKIGKGGYDYKIFKGGYFISKTFIYWVFYKNKEFEKVLSLIPTALL